MRIISLEEKSEIQNAVVTIGIFDGVHKGHTFILNKLMKRAKELNGHSVVVTLWPHPRIVLNKDVWNFRLLHSQEEKIRHLDKLGIDYLMIVPFSMELASLDACDFVKEYLIDKLNVARLLIGYDNRFGKDRKGDPEGLMTCSDNYGFIIEELVQYKSLNGDISSSNIRSALLKGNLDLASELLEYEYYLSGTVVQGNHVGRKLGYPTANINPHSAYKLIPRDGVYAVRVELEGVFFYGMLNIGVRPTLDSPNPVKLIEVHILDFEGDLYDRDIVVHFSKRIRDEKRFPGLESLRNQLIEDEKLVRAYYKIG